MVSGLIFIELKFRQTGTLFEAIGALEVKMSGVVLGENDDAGCYWHTSLRFE